MSLVGLIAFDLLRFGWKFTPFTDPQYFFPLTEALAYLQNQQRPFRIATTDSRVLPPNVAAYFGIESIEGYDPITLRVYEEFIAASERGKPDITPPYGFNRIITPHNVDSPLLPLLNVRYVVSLVDINRSYLRKVFQEGDTRIYEDSRAVPRAYFVESVQYERNRREILKHLFAPHYQPKQTAFVERPVSLVSVPLLSSEFVRIMRYKEQELVLDVAAANARFLVISNIFYPGWQVAVDGKRVEMYRTNYVFEGIVVPSGRHTIVLRYRG